MSTINERLEQFAELQNKNLEPVRNAGSAAFTAFERIARKNYELMGDMVDYAVAQSRGSLERGSPQEHYERQIAEARAFAERMGARAAEYLALAEQLRGDLADDMADMAPGGDAAPPAADAVAAAAKKVVSKKRAATKAAADAAAAVPAAATSGRKKSASKKRAAAKKGASKKTSASKKKGAAKR